MKVLGKVRDVLRQRGYPWLMLLELLGQPTEVPAASAIPNSSASVSKSRSSDRGTGGYLSYPPRILHDMNLDWYFRESDTKRSMLPLVVFDGDDTLWMTESLYDTARERSAGVVTSVGLEPARFEKLQREIDVTNFTRYGLSPKRFPTSSSEAYLALAAEVGVPALASVAQAVYDASASVFETAAPLATHAEKTLRELRPTYRTMILTKGDPVVQRRRVDESGLAPFLDAACIVEVKDAAVFMALLKEMGVEAATSWSIGNSYGSDVHPAVMAGMRAIWIDARVWAHERSLSERTFVDRDPNVFIATALDEISSILRDAPLESP